jgi:hypothetical protein
LHHNILLDPSSLGSRQCSTGNGTNRTADRRPNGTANDCTGYGTGRQTCTGTSGLMSSLSVGSNRKTDSSQKSNRKDKSHRMTSLISEGQTPERSASFQS